MKTDKIYFGAAYYDEYMPCDRIDTDFKMMKEAGINIIRIAESTWSNLEPADGVFDFTHIDRMLEYAARYELSVIVGTPTYAIPTWLNHKYPDILAVTHNGPAIYGHRQNMDITHPGYLKHSERVIRQLITHVANVPCVVGYQVDNETKPYDTCGPNVQRDFVNYLRKRFPDINAFNHEFGLDYWSNRINSWEDFPDIRGTINGSLSAEFKKYQRELVTRFFNWQIDIIEELKRDNQFITHNFDYYWIGHSYGLQPEVNQFEACRRMDVVGGDIYHPSGALLTGAEISFGGDILRGLKRDNYLILETEAQGNMAWLTYKRQLRLQAYSHIANGANSVMYWHWHSIHNAIESYWKGILSHNLKENATYREISVIGNELKTVGSHIKNLKKNNHIAIMLNNESLTGIDEFPAGNGLDYNNVFRWFHDALYYINGECDIIPAQAEPEILARYSLIIIPAMYSATEEVIERIRAYVYNGGHIIMSFRSCFADEHIKIYADNQPHGLTECFGMTYDQFTTGAGVSVVFDGNREPVNEYMELLIPSTASVLASYSTGNPEFEPYEDYAAATYNQYGKGAAMYLGCSFSEHTLMTILEKECISLGIVLPKERFPVVIREGINDNGNTIRYYLNYSGSTVTATAVSDGTDILTGRTITSGQSLAIEPWNLIIMEVSECTKR